MIKKSKGLCLLLALVLCLNLSISGFALEPKALDEATLDATTYLYQKVPSPQVGSIGGEWAVLGLARSGIQIPDTYYQTYASTVENYVSACHGILHEKKYTEYARLTLALTAIGKDPRSVAGYNLLTPLGDYDKTIWQGLNGPIMALIALDSGNYPMPQTPNAKTQATRELYLQYILDAQLSDGGWSLVTADNSTADPDITGMALQALSNYQNHPSVKQATEKALSCMSKAQNAEGGFSSWGATNSESSVQMIVALCSLSISLDDARFVKNGHSILDYLMTFYQKGNGFLHVGDGGGSNQMATEQGVYALVAVQRAQAKKPSLYRMTDALKLGDSTTGTASVLPGKHADVKVQPLTHPAQTFSDIQAHHNQVSIEALASRSIINGFQDGLFHPNDTMTRAEFATIVVKALGLPQVANHTFADVNASDWFAAYVGTAYQYGIVNGTSATLFTPQGTITREEAATMLARAAKLCGMDTGYDIMAARDILAQFGDYVKCSSWSIAPLAFCYDQGLLDRSALKIQPKTAILRCEIAQMLYELLSRSNLL